MIIIMRAAFDLIVCNFKSSGGKTIEIAGVVAPLVEPRFPSLVPSGFVSRLLQGEGSGGGEFSAETLAHLRWMLQKDVLQQDMFLLGSPGPARRQLVQAFAELCGREVEYVGISRDTTEADLKQRRELTGNGTSVHRDAAPVRAALHGRLLILDGIEKAERNVSVCLACLSLACRWLLLLLLLLLLLSLA
jgi:hypothetical protein